MTVQRGQRYILSLAFLQPETGSRNYAKRLFQRWRTKLVINAKIVPLAILYSVKG